MHPEVHQRRHVRASGERLQVDVSYFGLDVRAIPFGINLWLVKCDDIHPQNTARSRDLAGKCGDRSSRLRRPRSGAELRITPDLDSATDREVARHARNSTQPAHGSDDMRHERLLLPRMQ